MHLIVWPKLSDSDRLRFREWRTFLAQIPGYDHSVDPPAPDMPSQPATLGAPA
jgi:hypothetical protein